jgi:hypothetical protein
LAVKAMIRPGMENKFWAAMTNAMNFFKHADRDADAILDVNEAFSDAIIMIAIMNYVDLGNQQSAEMIAFSTWYRLINPEMLAAPVREQIRNIDATDYGAAPRAKQLEAGRQLLNMNRGRPG